MNKILSFSLLFTLSIQILAQQIYLLPKAGISISNVDYKKEITKLDPYGINIEGTYNYYGRNSILGVSGGMGIEIGLTKNNSFAIQPEISFLQTGIKFGGNSIFKINYLEIPLLVKYTLSLNKFKIFVNAGPSFGFGVGGKYKHEYSGGTYTHKIIFKNPKENDIIIQSKTDFNLQIGGGIGYQVGKYYVWIEGRYGKGYTRTNSYNNSMPPKGYIKEPYDWTFYNRFVMVNAGIAIPLTNRKNI